jgi:ribosomal protein S17E
MWDVLIEVVKKANSELFLFLFLLIFCVVILVRPLYKQVTDAGMERHKQDFEHTKQILEVIRANTNVLGELKTLFEDNKSICIECKKIQMLKLDSIELKVSKIVDTL